ncbi:chromatin target of PRMT1 protein-like [Vanessa atalanta]|uniref:chromatin target of PRMT1 protein-like n=1 Tax=Vanessa atalanta TaxID=42275 RepID=UPI001FCD37B1|nr:chromatin target of PRMT1 protein-like [Vanessa atalanta]
MVIEKVHGLQATRISLNDRFTILASAATVAHVMKPRRRPSGLFSFNHNVNNRVLMDQIAYRLGQQSRKQAVKQRLGMPGLRRFGSESSLIGLQRSNSFNNLNQNSIKNRVAWRQSNMNLNRSASFSNLSQGVWRGRGFRRRGGRMGVMRGRMRGRGGRAGRAGRPVMSRSRTVTPNRGRGRGGVTRQQKTVPTKEELDLQLDQYMASTKSALDKELDTYMKNAMDLE